MVALNIISRILALQHATITLLQPQRVDRRYNFDLLHLAWDISDPSSFEGGAFCPLRRIGTERSPEPASDTIACAKGWLSQKYAKSNPNFAFIGTRI
jgi:hypothetical protein